MVESQTWVDNKVESLRSFFSISRMSTISGLDTWTSKNIKNRPPEYKIWDHSCKSITSRCHIWHNNRRHNLGRVTPKLCPFNLYNKVGPSEYNLLYNTCKQDIIRANSSPVSPKYHASVVRQNGAHPISLYHNLHGFLNFKRENVGQERSFFRSGCYYFCHCVQLMHEIYWTPHALVQWRLEINLGSIFDDCDFWWSSYLLLYEHISHWVFYSISQMCQVCFVVDKRAIDEYD